MSEHETDVLASLEGFVCDVELGFEYFPGEAAIMYYDGGNGYPGSGPEIYLFHARVEVFYGHHTINRCNMGGWEKDFDRLALAHLEEELDGDLYDQLVDSVEGI